MKISLRAMATDASAQTGNHAVFEREVWPDEAFQFLSRLVSPQDIIYLEESHGSLNFWKHEGCLWMELYTTTLWATSQVNEIEAKAIIDMLARGDKFSYCIPTTKREWDAYAPLDDALITKAQHNTRLERTRR
jgi:hypothetical protein